MVLHLETMVVNQVLKESLTTNDTINEQHSSLCS
jgi:hypothetical protein